MLKRVKKSHQSFSWLSKGAVIAFLGSLILCSLMVVMTIYNKANSERLEMEQIIIDKSVKINDVISRLLYKTEALSALVVQGGGKIEDFERVAATIIDDPAILNVIIAPDGIVSDVYPLEGNEAVIGLDYFSKGAGNREAIMAIETGSLVFGGPFELVQGGQALVGRLPVYLEDSGRNRRFWGIVSVTLKYPQALDGAGLDVLEMQGYAYEVWRYNVDDGNSQIIATGNNETNPHARFIEKKITILNAEWYFRVSPVRQWYQYTENWIMIVSALLVSFMVGFVIQNNYHLRVMKAEIELMANTDGLTEIFNRRYFMKKASLEIEKACAEKRPCCIAILDIDYFKNLNDVYGHYVGDVVLKGFAARIQKAVSPGGLFARYGGEEFIIFLKDMGCDEAREMMEYVRRLIYESPFEADGISVYISASFGVALVNEDGDLDDALKKADGALYMAKGQGRNRVIVCDLPEPCEFPTTEGQGP